MTNIDEEQSNFSRVASIIVDLLPKVQRDFLSATIPVANFQPNALNPKILNRLNRSQKAIVKNIVSYDECDASLLYIIIRNLCNIIPTNGWEKPVSQHDIDVADDIERLRVIRNEIYGHATTAKLANTDYNTIVQRIRGIVSRFDNCHGGTYTLSTSSGSYEKELDYIISKPMDPALQKHYNTRVLAQDVKIDLLTKDLETQDIKIDLVKKDLESQNVKIEKDLESQNIKIEKDLASQNIKIEKDLASQNIKIEKDLASQNIKIEKDLASQNIKIETDLASQNIKIELLQETISQFSSDTTNTSTISHQHELEYVYRMDWICNSCGTSKQNSNSYYCTLCNYDECTTCVTEREGSIGTKDSSIGATNINNCEISHTYFVKDTWCICCHHSQNDDDPVKVLRRFNRRKFLLEEEENHELYESGFIKFYSENAFDKELQRRFVSTFSSDIKNQPWLLTNLDTDYDDNFYKICDSLRSWSINTEHSFLIVDYSFEDHVKKLKINLCDLKKELKIYEKEDFARRILLYKGDLKTLFIVRQTDSTSKEDISNEVIKGQHDMKMFSALHMNSLSKSNITIVSVVVTCNLSDIELFNLDVCRKCSKENFIIPADYIKNRLEDIEEVIRERMHDGDTLNTSKESTFLSLASRIIGFLSIENVNLPNISHLGVDTLSRVYLNKQQRTFLYSRRKHEILQGGFGSGKTILAQLRFMHLLRTADPRDSVYLFIHSNETLLKKLMQNQMDKIKNKRLSNDNIFIMNADEYCEKFGLKAPLVLSDILQDLAERYHESPCKPHLIMDELDGSIITEKEGNTAKRWLEELKDSRILLVTHSLEIFRKRIKPKFYFFSANQLFDGFKYGATGMNITVLNQTMRNSIRINALSQQMIRTLKNNLNVFYETILTPIQPSEEESSENGSSFVSHPQRQHENTSVNNLDMDLPEITAPEQVDVTIEKKKALISFTPDMPSTSKEYELIQYDVMDQKKEERIEPVALTTNIPRSADPTSPHIVNYGFKKHLQVSINIDHALKHINESSKPKSGVRIVSKFKFPGTWEHGHNVPGKIPELLHPFGDECLDYSNINNPDVRARLCYVVDKVAKLRRPINGVGVICFEVIDAQLFYEVLKSLGFSVVLYIPAIDSDTKPINTRDCVIITDHVGSRGLEFTKLIVSVNPNESCLHQYLLEGITRCIDQLYVVVIDKELKGNLENITCGNIIEDWVKEDLVKTQIFKVCPINHENDDEPDGLCTSNPEEHLIHQHDLVPYLSMSLVPIEEVTIDVGRCIEVFKRLSNTQYIDGHVSTKESEQSILQECSRKGFSSYIDVFSTHNTKMIDYLMKKKYAHMVRFRDPNGNTMLHLAIQQHSNDSAISLILNGMPMDIKNNQNITPLDLATDLGMVNVIRETWGYDYKVSEDKFEHLKRLIHINDNNHVVWLVRNFPELCELRGNFQETLLYEAAKTKNMVITRELIRNGSDVRSIDNTGKNVLHVAVKYSHLDIVTFLYDNYPILLMEKDSDNQIPTDYDVKAFVDERERLILKYKRTFDKFELIKSWINMGKNEEVTFLIRLFSNIVKLRPQDRRDNYQFHSGTHSGFTGYIDGNLLSRIQILDFLKIFIFQELLEKYQFLSLNIVEERNLSADIQDTYSEVLIENEETPEEYSELIELENKSSLKRSLLYEAVLSNNLVITKKLIDNGANVYSVDESNQNVLHKAIKYDKIDIVEFIGNTYPALIDMKDVENRLPAEYADEKSKTVIDMITGNLCFGTFVEKLKIQCERNGLCSYHDILRNHRTDILEKFLVEEKGYIMHFKNEDGNSFLHLAVEYKSSKCIEALVNMGMSIDLLNHENKTPMDIAIKYGVTELFNFLAESWINQYQSAISKFNHIEKLMRENRKTRLNYLIEMFPEVSKLRQYNQKYSLLHIAVQTNNLEAVKRLLGKGSAEDAVDRDGNNIIHNFIRNGIDDRIECIQYLLNYYPELVKMKNHVGVTPLQLAKHMTKPLVANILENAVSALFKKKIDGECTKYGLSSPQVLFNGNYLNVIKTLLIEDREGMESFKDENGDSVLHWAVKCESIDSVGILVNEGMPYNLTNKENNTPLDIAKVSGRIELFEVLTGDWKYKYQAALNKFHHVEELIKRNQNDNFKYILHEFPEAVKFKYSSGRGETLLHIATYTNNMIALKELIHKGSDVYAVDSDGDNVLSYALYFGWEDPIDCIEYLCENYPKLITMKNLRDLSTVEIARKFLFNWRKDSRRTLLEEMYKKYHGMPYNLTNKENNTPLDIAKASGRIELFEVLTGDWKYKYQAALDKFHHVEELIKRNQNDNFKYILHEFPEAVKSKYSSGRGETLLHIATYTNNMIALKELIHKGSDVYAVDRDGDNVLSYALYFGWEDPIDCIEYLCENYPKLITMKNFSDLSTVEIARKFLFNWRKDSRRRTLLEEMYKKYHST